MNIGQLSKASGVNARSIRYYERIGLIPPAERTGGNYRSYHPDDVELLKFIKRSRSLGFSLSEIETLLGLWKNKNRHSAEVRALAQKHILELEAKIEEMQSVIGVLRELVGLCHGNADPDCPIIENLAGSD